MAMIALIASCTPSKRHRVLSFFFDGVPPLPGRVETQTSGNGQSLDVRRRPPEPVWFVHEPQDNCVQCHGEREQRNFSREVHLTAPVPHLCYGCHETMSSLSGWIHGPVAAGQCVLCHDPHRSRFPFLLKKAVPELCLQCHQSLETVENHTSSSYEACLDCHSGHASVSKHLLKAGSPETQTLAGASEPTGDPEFDSVLAVARQELQGETDLNEAWNNVAAYTRQGDIKKARAYLMAIRMEPALSDAASERWSALQDALEASEQSQERQEQQAQEKQALLMAQLYYQSVNACRDGDYVKARSGFTELLNSDVVPDVIKQAIHGYLDPIQQQTSQGEAPR